MVKLDLVIDYRNFQPPLLLNLTPPSAYMIVPNVPTPPPPPLIRTPHPRLFGTQEYIIMVETTVKSSYRSSTLL